jgi:putative hemolysin
VLPIQFFQSSRQRSTASGFVHGSTRTAAAEARAATGQAMVDVFGAQVYHLFGQKPDLQLVTASTTSTTERNLA